MLTFRIDKENNVLFVNIIGMTPKDKMADYINDYTHKCAQLQENFMIINDMSLCKISSHSDVELICKVSQMMNQKFSILKIIRIVGSNEEIMKQFLSADTKIGLENIHYALNRKEALEFATPKAPV